MGNLRDMLEAVEASCSPRRSSLDTLLSILTHIAGQPEEENCRLSLLALKKRLNAPSFDLLFRLGFETVGQEVQLRAAGSELRDALRALEEVLRVEEEELFDVSRAGKVPRLVPPFPATAEEDEARGQAAPASDADRVTSAREVHAPPAPPCGVDAVPERGSDTSFETGVPSGRAGTSQAVDEHSVALVESDTLEVLREMGFTQEQVTNAASKATRPNDIDAILEVLFSPDEFLPSSSNEVFFDASETGDQVETGLTTPAEPCAEPEDVQPSSAQTWTSSEDKASQLMDMGFSRERVAAAVEAAPQQTVDELLTALLSGDEEQQATTSERTADAAQTTTAERVPSFPTSHTVLSTVAALDKDGTQLPQVSRLLVDLELALERGMLTEAELSRRQVDLANGRVDAVQAFVSELLLSEVPSWTCSICYTEQTVGWRCPEFHRFCGQCMRLHVEATPLPRCPQPDCGYDLREHDLTQLCVEQSRIDAFNQAKLSMAVDRLAAVGEVLVRCSRPECANAVLFPSTGRQCFRCADCHAEPFCTRCRQAPYHFHAECGKVQPLREQWLSWLSGGRETYYGRARNAEVVDQRNQALYDGIARHNELQADERWKAENCRECPGCSRPVSKIAGCSSMKCGQAYHGGDQQPGCGQEFNWERAKPYRACVQRIELPSLENAQVRGKGVFHPFVTCCLCDKHGFSGPRFQCLNCPAFDVCGACEPKLAEFHMSDHVFDILFESGLQAQCEWLPRGTRVRIVRSGSVTPCPMTRGSATDDLEGRAGTVVRRRRPPLEGYEVELDLDQGTMFFDMMFLEPMVESRDEAATLLNRILEADADAPSPIPVQLPSGFAQREVEEEEEDFADDSPL